MPEINVTFNSATASTDVWDGSVSEIKAKGRVYSVAKASQLAWIAEQTRNGENFSEKIVRLMANVNLNGMSWTPIGDEKNPFEGSFEGQTNSIMNLRTETAYAGLFGFLGNNAKVSKLGMKGTFTAVNAVAAGTISAVNKGIIEDCFNACSMAVNGTEDLSAGGLAGINLRMIVDCFNDAEIKTDGCARAGGIAGTNQGIIEDCYNEGRVFCISTKPAAQINIYAGGLAGTSQGFVGKSYNEGCVEASLAADSGYVEIFAGGACGWNSGVMNDCYNLQKIKASVDVSPKTEILILNTYAGGACGWNAGTVEKCYNEGEIYSISKADSGIDEAYAGGIAGINHGNIHQSRNMKKAYGDASSSKNVHVLSIAGLDKGMITDSF